MEDKILNKASNIRNASFVIRHSPALRFPDFEGEWVEKRLGETLTIAGGKDYKHLGKGDIPVYGTGGYMTSVDEYLFDGESIGIGRKGTIDKPVLLQGKFWTVDTLFYTHSFIDSNPKFLYLIFQKINWKKYNEASGVPSLSKKTIEKIKVNIPPLPEQTKIATFLAAVDKKIAVLEERVERLELYKRGVMQKIFSCEIRFERDDGGVFKDWVEKRLGDVGRIVTGKTPSTSNIDLWGGDIDFITPTDIIDNKKYQIKTNRTVVKQTKMKILDVGSIVYTCIASIGKMCITMKPSITNQQINSIMVNDNINNEFIYYYLLKITPYIQSTQANTTLPIINKTDFSKFKINLPSLPEQKKIATYLSTLDKQIENAKTQAEQTRVWKQGLLQGLFA